MGSAGSLPNMTNFLKNVSLEQGYQSGTKANLFCLPSSPRGDFSGARLEDLGARLSLILLSARRKGEDCGVLIRGAAEDFVGPLLPDDPHIVSRDTFRLEIRRV